MISDPHVSALLWIGLTLTLLVGVVALLPLWVRAADAWSNSGNQSRLTPFLTPFLLTAVMLVGGYMITLGGTQTAKNAALHNVEAAKPRPDFTATVKTDEEAIKPQTRAELAAERERKAAEEAAATKSEAEKFDEFRKELGTDTPNTKTEGADR